MTSGTDEISLLIIIYGVFFAKSNLIGQGI